MNALSCASSTSVNACPMSDCITGYVYALQYVINCHTIALFVPLPAVIVSLSVEEYHYKVLHFPPTICISSRTMLFYSIIVIIDVLVAIGVYLLIIVFWIINKVIYINMILT